MAYLETPHKPYNLKRLVQTLTLPLILLLAALLRFYRLAGQSLWSDEGNSVVLARSGFMEIARRTAFDIHPPFYYWLLKIWIAVFGESEFALRSLSAVLGVATVWLVWLLGKRLFGPRIGLMAAFIAAVSPLQVYYAQETRMYMLLAFLGCLTVLLGLLFLDRPRNLWLNLAYVLTVVAGFYTHYAYPVIFIALNLAVLFYFIYHSKFKIRNVPLIRWHVLQLIPLLIYLPWLPTAWRQLTTWPSEIISISLREVIIKISNTLLFGLSWPFATELLAFIILGLMLIAIPALTYILRNTKHAIGQAIFPLSLLYLWLLLPVGLTLIIFSPAFLKFLLAAAPPLALLLALFITLWAKSIQSITHSQFAGYLVGSILLLGLSFTSVVSLYHSYTNPAYTRDDYRAIVSFIKAVGSPDDAIILHAEGQQDVFNYYFDQDPPVDISIHPLPRQRPLNETATRGELRSIANTTATVYGVYWATRQADPSGLIETWLDTHLYKATDQWYGNVRLVSYAVPQTNNNFTQVDVHLGDSIRLTGYGLASPQIAPGDILQLALQWQTTEALPDNYTVFIQVLDPANHLAGQRDAPPLTPTANWPVNKPVNDAHGVFIEPGTPPGRYRLIVGLYHRQTGQRLPVTGENGKDFVELAPIEIIRPAAPLPREAFDIQVPLDASLGDITLVGYDLYKLGQQDALYTLLHPGDPIHLTLYWSPKNDPTPLTVQVVDSAGNPTPVTFTMPLEENIALTEESNGEIIRSQADFFLPNLPPGQYRLAFNTETGIRPVFSQPFSVQKTRD